MPTGSWTVVPTADEAQQAWTPTPSGDLFSTIDEGIATPDTDDFLDATVINKNYRMSLTDAMPALCKEITQIDYKFVCTGRIGSTGVDASMAMRDSSGVDIPGFFKQCDIVTTSGAPLNWRARTWVKIGTPGGGGPVVTPRSEFTGAIQVLMKSITGGSGETADEDDDPDIPI